MNREVCFAMNRHRLPTILCFALCMLPAVLAGLSANPRVDALALLWPCIMAVALVLALVIGAIRM